jgi:hypothetical protein
VGIETLIATNLSFMFSIVQAWASQPKVSSVPIQTSRYRVRMTSEVSKHVLVDTTGLKKFVNDNVAPGPHEWYIEGYIGGEISGAAIEHIGRSELMPSIMLARAILESAYQSRAVVPFIDAEQKAWTTVVIQDFECEKTPDVQNRLMVRITLRELNILSASVLPAGVEKPEAGTEFGAVASGPAAATTPITSGMALPDVVQAHGLEYINAM